MKYKNIIEITNEIYAKIVDPNGGQVWERILFAGVTEEGIPVLLKCDENGYFSDVRNNRMFVGIQFGWAA